MCFVVGDTTSEGRDVNGWNLSMRRGTGNIEGRGNCNSTGEWRERGVRNRVPGMVECGMMETIVIREEMRRSETERFPRSQLLVSSPLHD